MTPLLQRKGATVERAQEATRPRRPALQTDAISVIYTGFDETLSAARVAADLAAKLNAPLRVVHFRTVPRQLDVDRPDGLSPISSEVFTSRLLEEGIAVRARVFLCRDEMRTIPYAFKPHSIVVIGGRHSWFPTHVERWRRALEDAGHFVVLVDPSEQKEQVHA